MNTIKPCSFESYTKSGWSAIEADLAACWYETGDKELLKQLLAIIS